VIDGLSASLILAAVGIAATHTLLGPDHYLPFIMLARARNWGRGRLVAVTAVCGLGHVLGSLFLGGIGVALGLAVGRVEEVEAGRGALAAILLVAFGVAYGAWGVRKALRRRRGIEPHTHDGHVHLHTHGDRSHHHAGGVAGDSPLTFWSILLIFVLGPCEPLIPLFVLPASRGRWDLAIVTAAVFGAVTVGAMIGMVLLGSKVSSRLELRGLTRWEHALAGGIIASSGLAILFLGL